MMSIIAIGRKFAGFALPCFLFGVPALGDPPQLTEHRESAAALQGLDLTSVSLPRAIAVIESKTGGKVMDIQVANNGGQPVYDAVVVMQGKVGTVRITGKGGAVSTMGDDQFSVSSMDWHERADVKSFMKATLPLASAIKNAEQDARGATAINAGLAKPLSADNAVLAYNIEIVMNGQARRLAVDAGTGEVIADPGALGLGDRDPSQFLP